MLNSIIIKTMDELVLWINSLPVDSVRTCLIRGKCITGTVVEIWDEGFDSCDYKYRFSINGKDAEEADLYDLVRKNLQNLQQHADNI